jgi:hypothetical protein
MRSGPTVRDVSRNGWRDPAAGAGGDASRRDQVAARA